MGFEGFPLIPFLLPGLVLVAAALVLPLGEIPDALGVSGGPGASFVWVASQPSGSGASPVSSGDGTTSELLPGNAQAYSAGMVAAAFLIGVVLVTRGRFYP